MKVESSNRCCVKYVRYAMFLSVQKFSIHGDYLFIDKLFAHKSALATRWIQNFFNANMIILGV